MKSVGGRRFLKRRFKKGAAVCDYRTQIAAEYPARLGKIRRKREDNE